MEGVIFLCCLPFALFGTLICREYLVEYYAEWCVSQNDHRRMIHHRISKEQNENIAVPISDLLADFETPVEGLTFKQKVIRHSASLYFYWLWAVQALFIQFIMVSVIFELVV